MRPKRRLRDGDRGGDGGTSALQMSHDPTSVSPSSSSWLSPPLSPGLLTIELEMKNLELLHHFTTSTYQTISTDEDIREVWRLVIPRIALSHEFLMHALLAMSALHLSFLKSSDKPYALMAAEHHRKALGPLRTAFSALESHGNALFAASSVTAMYVYACPPVVESMVPKAPVWIPLFRGVWATTVGCFDRVRQGELAPLLAHKAIDQSRYVGEDIEFPNSLFDLSQPGAPGVLDPEELEDGNVLGIYNGATEGLKLSWDRFWSTEPKVSSALTWPCTMSEEFVGFIEEHRPRALVLLAHHFALVESLEDVYWWAKGRGMDEIKRIESVMDEKWKHWLDWPISRCKISKGAG